MTELGDKLDKYVGHCLEIEQPNDSRDSNTATKNDILKRLLKYFIR